MVSIRLTIPLRKKKLEKQKVDEKSTGEERKI
jgi:hypothetical protein